MILVEDVVEVLFDATNNTSSDIPIINIIKLGDALQNDYSKVDEANFILIIDESISNKEAYFKVIDLIAHPNYYLFDSKPLMLLENHLSEGIQSTLLSNIYDFGYNKVHSLNIKSEEEIYIIYTSDGSELKICPIQNAEEIELYQTIYIILNNTFNVSQYKLLSNLNRKLFLHINNLMRKQLAIKSSLDWKSKQLENSKTFLELLKTDRSLIIFNRVERMIKKRIWLKKILKKILR